MILKEVKQYVKTHQQVSLNDVAVHFDVQPEAVKGMLEFWVRKGKMKKFSSSVNCASACSCAQKDNQETYIWNPQINQISIEVT